MQRDPSTPAKMTLCTERCDWRYHERRSSGKSWFLLLFVVGECTRYVKIPDLYRIYSEIVGLVACPMRVIRDRGVRPVEYKVGEMKLGA